jgi:2-polyprenyl-3-methyl-5-hydroxy-6-metoxy-1,4-benzoquinol methylase
MASSYDPHHIARFFDEYAEREWDRHDADATSLVSFHLHRRYLEQYVKPGNRVLEAGTGAGRFTVELARLGARVTAGDISPGQYRPTPSGYGSPRHWQPQFMEV